MANNLNQKVALASAAAVLLAGTLSCTLTQTHPKPPYVPPRRGSYYSLNLNQAADVGSPSPIFCKISDGPNGECGFREQDSYGNYILPPGYTARLYFPKSGATAYARNGDSNLDTLIFRQMGIGYHPFTLELLDHNGHSVPFYAPNPETGVWESYGPGIQQYSSVFGCTSINEEEHKGGNPPGRRGGEGQPNRPGSGGGAGRNH